MTAIARATRCYLWFEGSWSLLHSMAFTLALLFQVQVADLSPLQLVLVGTAMEAACFLFEVPTGVVADLFSRRLSVLLGAGIVGAALLAQGVWPTFWPILAAQVLWGLGYTFVSGALDAWITDEVGDDAVHPLFVRANQQHLALTIAGTLLAGALGHLDLRLPLVVAGAGYLVLVAAMVGRMPETGFTPASSEDRQTVAHAVGTLRSAASAVRTPGVVRSFMLVALLVGISSEVFDRLWTARVLDAFSLPRVGLLSDPAAWFTGFRLVGTLLALVVSLAAHRWATRLVTAEHPAGLLASLVLVQAVGFVGFALSASLWPAMAAMWLRDAARNLAAPVQAAWLNRNVDSATRATVISMVSQADAVGQTAGGPPLGLLAARTSIPIGILASAALLAPAALALARLPRPVQTAPGLELTDRPPSASR